MAGAGAVCIGVTLVNQLYWPVLAVTATANRLTNSYYNELSQVGPMWGDLAYGCFSA